MAELGEIKGCDREIFESSYSHTKTMITPRGAKWLEKATCDVDSAGKTFLRHPWRSKNEIIGYR